MQGAVGLEGLSRGIEQAHFVEMDGWICKQCLTANVEKAGFKKVSTVHADKVEDFLERAARLGSFLGGAFNYVSVCPPYMTVSYPEIYRLLGKSPLIDEQSVVLVEYSKQNKQDIADTLGPLSKVKDTTYGRTQVAIYA